MTRIPDDVHSSCPDLRIATHDWDAGGKRPVDAEHHKLCATWNNSQVAVCKRVVASGEEKPEENEN